MNDRHIVFLPNIAAKRYSFDPVLRTRRFHASTNKVRNNDAPRNAGLAKIDMKKKPAILNRGPAFITLP